MSRARFFRAAGAPLLGFLALALTTGCATVPPAPGGTSDGNVVAVAMASNSGEVVTSQPATSRAASQAVRDFAQRMVTDHTAANQQLQNLGIAPMENEISRQLAANAQQTVQALSTYEGAAFDRAYMQAQVDLHRWTLSGLDSTLIPSARNRRLRAQLQTMRTAVAAHLQQAEQIVSGLR